MKTISSHSLKAALFSGALLITTASLAQAQRVETTTTTTTAEGTITEFGPQEILINASGSAQPVRYTFSERTTYVDETGAPVSASVIRSGAPATVYYTRVGDALIADKVMVRTRVEPAAVQTTQTDVVTSTGVISDFGPERLVIRSQTSPEPLNYTFSKTTTYVDDLGNPVEVSTVRSGQPVTVQYVRQGNQLVASKVIIKRAAAPAVPVVEEKTTTTRTTVTE
ncbi:hypothetical protein WJU23_00485 [Prosthecobacter sp. SYSU 5D2]|uniref:hypothetical protein n=1 Tax=Prosthecobacter sp. SYSU 5D2 TaxID=3134134 RepID=UPI0031FE615B